MHFFDAISSAQEFLSYRHCPRLNDMSECDALKTLQKCRPKGLPSRQTPVLEDDENDEVFIFSTYSWFAIPGALSDSGPQDLSLSGLSSQLWDLGLSERAWQKFHRGGRCPVENKSFFFGGTCGFLHAPVAPSKFFAFFCFRQNSMPTGKML